MPNKGERAADGSQRQAGLAKRFYKQVTTESEGGEGTALQLDGKPVRTPGKAALRLPTRGACRGGRRGVARAR